LEYWNDGMTGRNNSSRAVEKVVGNAKCHAELVSASNGINVSETLNLFQGMVQDLVQGDK
jgi:hypothetical protein